MRTPENLSIGLFVAKIKKQRFTAAL